MPADGGEPAQRNKIISKPFLCFAACLQIAVSETNGATIDQVAVANQLGVALPDGFDCSELIEQGIRNIHFDPNPDSWGIQPILAEVNAVLKTANAPLECSFEPVSRLQDWEFEERLAVLIGLSQFPIVGFDYNSLFDSLDPGDRGHCVVVYGIHRIGGEAQAEIYNPGPSRAGWKRVDSYSLYRACRKKHGGIWSVTPLAR